MKRYAGVFAQPAIDQTGRPLLKMWYDRGFRLFILWASTKNTAGAKPNQDRAAQLEWRDAVRKLGPDAVYMDYPLSDWRFPAATDDSDVLAMVNDPQCLGFYGPDEPNSSPPVGGNIWRMTPDQWYFYWRAIMKADPNDTKVRGATFNAMKLTSGWEWGYKAQDLLPYLTDPVSKRRILDFKMGDWYPKAQNYARYGNDLPAKGLRALGWTGQDDDERGMVLECSDQELNFVQNGVKVSGVPTPADMWDQYQQILTEVNGVNATGKQPLRAIVYFPQAPKPSAAHKFTNCTPAQWDMCAKIAVDFAPIGVLPAPLPEFASQQQVDRLRLDFDAAMQTIKVLQEQAKDSNGRINVLEQRKYEVVVK
jgi:hypothetical protein